MKKLFERLGGKSEDAEIPLGYGWVFTIVFFLVLFLSQALYRWVLGDVGSPVVWLLLILWSAGASYFLLFGDKEKTIGKMRRALITLLGGQTTAYKTDIHRMPEIERLETAPSALISEEASSPDTRALEEVAHDEGALISHDAIRYIASFGADANFMLKDLIFRARKKYPRFDGWVVLNKREVKDLLENDTDIQKDEAAYDISVPVNLPTGTLRLDGSKSVATFLELLCNADEAGLLTFMQGIRQGGEDEAKDFIKSAVFLLDRVHEHRTLGTGYVDADVLEYTNCFSTKELEEIIAILVAGIDRRYNIPDIGITLSVIRAIEFAKKHRSKQD